MNEGFVLIRSLSSAVRRLAVPALFTAALTLFSFSPAAGAGLEEGTPLPGFTGTDLAGNTVSSAAYKGRILLIDFWGITCAACLEEMPYLVDIFNRYNDQGFEALGINMDRSARKVKKFLPKLPFEMTYPNINDSKSQIMRLLKVQMLPTTLLVDRTGTIRMYHVGYTPGFEKELEEKVKGLLAEP